MKKLGKVLFVLALLAMVIMPLSAAKTMKVTWQWLLNDPDVTAYRYQLGGEDPSKWTVVDGKTDSYTATGLDPYSDYTLYLQCSYDKENWSETATSTANAMLVVEAPVEKAPVSEKPASVAAPVTEAVQAPVAEVAKAPLEKPVEKKAEKTTYTFSVFGLAVEGSYADGYFDAFSAKKGILTQEDILGFVAYENQKYGDALTSNVKFTLADDGIILQLPAGLDGGAYINQFQADIIEYVNVLFAPKTEDVAKVETAAAAEAQKTAYSFTVYGYGVEGSYADGFFDSYTSAKGVVSAEDILGFIAYENQKYGDMLATNITYTLVDNGFVLELPAGVDAGAYLKAYEADLKEYVESLFVPKAEVAAPQAEPVAAVEAPAAVEEPKTEAPVPEPVTDLRYKDVPVEETVPAVEKVKYNKFEFATTLRGGVAANLNLSKPSMVENVYLMGGLQVDLKNIFQVGSRIGFGLRLDGSVMTKPLNGGWKNAVKTLPGSFAPSKQDLKASASAELMSYLNLKKGTLFAGAGLGAEIARGSVRDEYTKTLPVIKPLPYGLYVSAEAGFSIDMGKHAAFGLDLGYKYFLSTKVQKVNAGAGISLVF